MNLRLRRLQELNNDIRKLWLVNNENDLVSEVSLEASNPDNGTRVTLEALHTKIDSYVNDSYQVSTTVANTIDIDLERATHFVLQYNLNDKLILLREGFCIAISIPDEFGYVNIQLLFGKRIEED